VTKHLPMRRWAASLLLLLAAVGCPSGTVTPTSPGELIVNAPIPGSGTTHLDCSWTQFGQNAAHTGTACAPAQGFTTVLATVTFDPFIEQEVLDAKAQSGQAALSVHYQAPLVTGDDVYLETKGGSYTGCTNFPTNSQGFTTPESSDGGPCGQNAWDSQVWSESYYRWEAGALVKVASFESDWKPEPGDLVIWEPVFHAALDGNVLWVPGAGGTVYQVDRTTMLKLAQVNPFGAVLDAHTFVAGPITVAPDGAVLYNVVQVAVDLSDVSGTLVRIEADGVTVHTASYSALMENPPAPDGGCLGAYYQDGTPPPWPPADEHRVSTVCGSLRPGVNIAPAVGADGTIFTIAFPNNAPNAGALLAVNPNLTPKWTATLQEIFDDGCGVLIPADADVNGKLPDGGTDYNHCLVGATRGVDPDTGQMPSNQVSDQSTSSPVVLPDGAVLYGGFAYYNNYRGHLVKFDTTGKLVASYDDGWDQTPAVWGNGSSYSVLVKDNHYANWSNDLVGPYAMTQVDANLVKQWSYTATNTDSCQRTTSGTLSCTSDHPQSFEWCVNAAAIDENGTVYANSEDGRVYAILQGGTVAQSRFLLQSLGAAYTPVTVDGQGRTYTLNGGVLTVVGK
jgi:hypothetical protein